MRALVPAEDRSASNAKQTSCLMWQDVSRRAGELPVLSEIKPRLSTVRAVHYTPAAMSLYATDTFGQLDPFLRREWLLTNGLGGYASGTVVGCNIRKYHGLLVAATTPPVGRVNTLARLGEQVILDGDVE